MRKLFSTLALVLAVFFSAFAAGKDRIIVHYNDQSTDTIKADIQFDVDGKQFIETKKQFILPEETTGIDFIIDGKIIRGFTEDSAWYFKIHHGNPLSIYAPHPKTNKYEELYFSTDEKKFIPYTKENMEKLFGTDESTAVLLKKFSKKRKLQKALTVSNASLAAGLAFIFTPAALPLLSVGVLSNTSSILLKNPVKKDLYKLVDDFNKSVKEESNLIDNLNQSFSKAED